MSQNHATRQSTEAPQKAASGERVLKSSIKQLPVANAKMWAKIAAAARLPRKERQYPELVEAPDA